MPTDPADDIPGLVREIRSLRLAALFVGATVCLHVIGELARPWLVPAVPASLTVPVPVPVSGGNPAGNGPETGSLFALPGASSLPVTATASGNQVTIQSSGPAVAPVEGVYILPDGPRTVDQVARYLGVTADTVRESYIPLWIAAGHMKAHDRSVNRWLIPGGWTPYIPK